MNTNCFWGQPGVGALGYVCVRCTCLNAESESESLRQDSVGLLYHVCLQAPVFDATADGSTFAFSLEKAKTLASEPWPRLEGMARHTRVFALLVVLRACATCYFFGDSPSSWTCCLSGVVGTAFLVWRHTHEREWSGSP